MADNIKELKFKVSGDTTELVNSWEKAKTSLNDLSAVLNAKAKAINGLSDVQQRNFDRLQELVKAEQELIRRTGLATLELGKIKEKVSKQVENGVLSEVEAYKRLQKDAATYYKFVEDQERKVRALSPTTVGATSTGGSDRSRPVKSDPNTYFDFAKNKLVNIKEEEEKLLKQREVFTKEFQERQVQRNKEFLDRQLHDEQSNINSRRVAQANLFTELLDKEEVQKKASILAAQTKQQQELAATKIQEENLRKQFASFQQNLSKEEAALKHSLQVQLQEHLTGIHSIEVARIQSQEKLRQLEERRTKLTNINSSRVQSGLITPEAGASRQQTINAAFVPAIHAANIQLAEQNKRIKDVAASYKGLHTVVRDIIAGYAVFVSLQNTVVAGFQKFLDVGIQLESVRASLTATAGSGARMENILTSLDKEAERTGIAIGTIRDSFKNLQASMSLAGESLNTTYKIFTNLDTVITALHLPAEKAQGIFLAIAQIFNKGKVQSEELVKQLGNLLPGAFAAFAAATGKSTLQLSKDMKNGLVFAHDTIEDFTSYMAQKFSVAFEISSRSMNSELGRLSTSFTHLGESIYAQTNGPIIGFVRGLTSAITAIDNFVKGESKFQNEARAGIELLAAAIGVGLVGALTKAALQSTFLANSLKAIAANPIGLAVVGAVTLGQEFTKIRSEAENLEEYLTKQEEKHRLLKEAVTGSKNLNEQQKLDFKVSNVESVKNAQKEVEKLEKQISTFNPLLFSKDSETAQKRLIELQVQLSRATKNYDEERKLAVQQIKEQTEQNEALFLDQRQTDLNTIREGELETIDTIQKAREKGLLEYKKKYEDILARQDQIIAAGTPHKRQDGSEADVSDKQIEAAKVASEMKKRIQSFEEEFALKSEKEFLDRKQSLADSAANAQIELAKKLSAQQEREQKLSHDRRLQELDQFLQLMQLKQGDSATSVSQSSFIQSKIDINKQRLIQLDIEYEKQKVITQELSKQVNLTASQVSNIGDVSEGFKKIAPIIDRLETGGLKNPYRAVSRTAAVGQHQFEPSTLKDLDKQGKINLQVPNFALEFERKGRAGQTLTSTEKEALANWAESIKSTLDQAFVVFVEDNIKYFKGDLLKAVVAHNAGAGGVDKAVNKSGEGFVNSLPKEARNYALKSGLTSESIPKSESKAIVQTQESFNDEEELRLKHEQERFNIQLENKKLEQELLLLKRSSGDEVIQQLITQKEHSGELVEAVKLQNFIDFNEKKIELSKKATSEEQQEINNRLLEGIKIQERQNLLAAEQEELIQAQSARAAELNLTFAQINQQQELGKLTDFEGIFQRQQAARERLPSATEDINRRIAITQANENLSPNQRDAEVAELQQQLLDLQTTAEGVSTYFRTELTDALTSSFMAYAQGSKTAVEATKAFGVAVVQMIAEIIIKKSAMIIVDYALLAVEMMLKAVGGFAGGGEVGSGGISSGASIGFSNVSSGFSSAGQSALSGTFASGGNVPTFTKTGMIKGPGTDTSDSIMAKVPTGSFILNAKATRLVKLSNNELFIDPKQVKKIGVHRLNKINEMGKFAGGGYVSNVIPLSSTNNPIESSEKIINNHYNVSVSHSGKESPEELGNKISIELMKRIGRQEATSVVAIYDKNKRFSNNRKV